MMEVLKSRGLTDLLVVVTRYFGGILLGAGGLVRAYSRSAAAAIQEAGEVAVLPALRYHMAIPYNRYGGLEPLLRERAMVEAVDFGPGRPGDRPGGSGPGPRLLQSRNGKKRRPLHPRPSGGRLAPPALSAPGLAHQFLR